MRGSDPDATIYWLAMMIEAGEDPLYIARRLIRFASEDVGMADPQALVIAMAAQQAVHFIGMPEGNLALAQAAVYLATAPKSNSLYEAYQKVQKEIKHGATEDVPLHLRNPVTPTMKEMGYGEGYKYAHDYPEHFVEQQNLPDSMKGSSTRRESWAMKNRSSTASRCGGRRRASQVPGESPRPKMSPDQMMSDF